MPGLLGSLLIDGHEDHPNQIGHWEYIQLRRNLEKLVSNGRVRKIAPFNPLYGGDDEEWYLDVEDGEIYALVPLSERFVPLWQKVDATTLAPASNKKRIGVRKWERPSKSQVISRRFTKAGKTVGYSIPSIRTGNTDKHWRSRDCSKPILSPAKPGIREEWC
jgi:hypothetical protein